MGHTWRMCPIIIFHTIIIHHIDQSLVRAIYFLTVAGMRSLSPPHLQFGRNIYCHQFHDVKRFKALALTRLYPSQLAFWLQLIYAYVDDKYNKPKKWPHFIWLTENIWMTTVTSKWARRCLKSPAFRVFAQPCVQAQIKVNIKAALHWPLWGGFTGDSWIPRATGQ